MRSKYGRFLLVHVGQKARLKGETRGHRIYHEHERGHQHHHRRDPGGHAKAKARRAAGSFMAKAYAS